ncbi:asparagine synthetase B, partial [Pseudomonas aeruginosa]|nr:asparagine synthetase B [Pseudomonas aeruginosa]
PPRPSPLPPPRGPGRPAPAPGARPRAPPPPPPPDAEAIAQVVAAGVPLEGQTLFQQVRLLLPGEVLRFDLSQERPRLCQRQRLATAPASEVDSLDEQLGETLERCRQTFRPCALLVSGGVDSNLLGSYLDPQLQRFHLCLEGDEESLLPHPRLQRFELRQEAFMPLLRRAVGNFGGATRMSSLLMYQRLADGIGEQGYHCVLLGEGADELFWGYPRHLELWRRRDAPEPRRFAAAWFGEYRRKAALLAEPAGRRVAERIEELAHEALGQGLEAAIGQFDLHYSLEPLLRRADHLLMSRTIEARTPYLHGALAQRAGGRPRRYDGYGGCPLTVERGRVVLAEFGYAGKLLPTFPLEPTAASRFAWLLKRHVLPWVYWNAMLKGREWLARPGR